MSGWRWDTKRRKGSRFFETNGWDQRRRRVSALCSSYFNFKGTFLTITQPEGELHGDPGEKQLLLAINGFHDIEEDIWSPKWGLKGKVDASVQATIIRNSSQGQDGADEHVAPLEIKTGRSVGVLAHRAQTMLYTLLMEDRYGGFGFSFDINLKVPQPFRCPLVCCTTLSSMPSCVSRPNRTRYEH